MLFFYNEFSNSLIVYFISLWGVHLIHMWNLTLCKPIELVTSKFWLLQFLYFSFHRFDLLSFSNWKVAEERRLLYQEWKYVHSTFSLQNSLSFSSALVIFLQCMAIGKAMRYQIIRYTIFIKMWTKERGNGLCGNHGVSC